MSVDNDQVKMSDLDRIEEIDDGKEMKVVNDGESATNASNASTMLFSDVSMGNVAKDKESNKHKRYTESSVSNVAVSISRGEMINAYRDLARYYANFGFFDSSNPDDMFERVFRPSILRCT